MANINLPPLTQQPILHIDGTPNDEYPIEDDNRRYTNVEDRERLHKVFDKLFSTYDRTRNVPIVNLMQNDFDVMLDTCMRWIEYIRGKE